MDLRSDLMQVMFMTLALVYLVIVDLLGRRPRPAPANPGDQVRQRSNLPGIAIERRRDQS